MCRLERKDLMKKRIVLAIVACVACLTFMVGCSGGAASPQTDEQSQNRQYMSSVNQIMDTLKTNMTDFSTAVKEGEVVSLSSQLDAVNKSVDELKALSVPEAMKDIHSKYVTGAEELQSALSGYVTLFQDVKVPANGTFDYATYADRLTEVKAHYDAGVAALQEADDKAAAA